MGNSPQTADNLDKELMSYISSCTVRQNVTRSPWKGVVTWSCGEGVVGLQQRPSSVFPLRVPTPLSPAPASPPSNATSSCTSPVRAKSWRRTGQMPRGRGPRRRKKEQKAQEPGERRERPNVSWRDRGGLARQDPAQQ